jgi:DNA-binding MarR family transcriptional regulator
MRRSSDKEGSGEGGQYDLASCRRDHPALVAWMGMARLVERTQRELDAQLRCHHLNSGQLDLLFHIGSADGLSQQELAERTGHSKANVSQLLDKLESAGLAQRAPEGRAYAVSITDEGRRLLGSLMPQQERLVLEQCRQLTRDERETLYRLMDKLEPLPE